MTWELHPGNADALVGVNGRRYGRRRAEEVQTKWRSAVCNQEQEL